MAGIPFISDKVRSPVTLVMTCLLYTSETYNIFTEVNVMIGIRPLGDRVVIKKVEAEEKTQGAVSYTHLRIRMNYLTSALTNTLTETAYVW